ncbi:MAG: HAD family hydrolase [Nitrososphaeria archaeon]|nr:HAD family hydrolase [Conexivisphaerales archaeon]
MKGNETLSLDLCGTLDDCNVYNHMWYSVIPEMYAEAKGMNFEKAKSAVTKAYKEVGPSEIEWYLPSYWINRFGLNYEEFLKKCENVRVQVPYELKKLKNKYRLILSTNVSKEVLKFSLLENFFDEIYSSVDLGYPKKDERFWKAVIDKENVKPFEIVHLGDDYVYDYLIPSSLGIRSKLSDLKHFRFNLFYVTGIRL